VVLSTVGAQATQTNLLTQLGIMEWELETLPMPIAFLQTAWFMENSILDVVSARNAGTVNSFLQPLEKPVPMVATDDIGRVAAEVLQQVWTGRRVVELEGPQRVTPLELGATFSKVLGRPVQVKAIPRSS
jgi:NAD(P)H dehydrogenase (quinone)